MGILPRLHYGMSLPFSLLEGFEELAVAGCLVPLFYGSSGIRLTIDKRVVIYH